MLTASAKTTAIVTQLLAMQATRLLPALQVYTFTMVYWLLLLAGDQLARPVKPDPCWYPTPLAASKPQPDQSHTGNQAQKTNSC